jgi:hypothetical protein
MCSRLCVPFPASAKSIATTAAAFGQQDDITVLTITRVAVGEESLVALNPAVSPSVS